MKTIPYKASHAINLQVREVETSLKLCKDFSIWAQANEEGMAYTTVNEVGTPFACGGIRPLWQGVGEAWLLLGKNYKPYRCGLYKVVASKVKLGIQVYHRVQAHCRVDFPGADHFLEGLGFQREGYMRQYYPDRVDAILYSIVREKK